MNNLCRYFSLHVCLLIASCASDYRIHPEDGNSDILDVGGIESMGVSTDTQEVFRILEEIYDENGREFVDCMTVDEIDGTHLCISSTVSHMEKALLRASIAIEGPNDIPRGTVLSLQSAEYLETIGQFAGFDLKGNALVNFWNDVIRLCQLDSSFCPNEEEIEFFDDFVVPAYRQDQNIVVITVPLDLKEYRKIVLDHEILHAQYFLEPGFSHTVNDFWEYEVGVMDKSAITQELSMLYDVDDLVLLRNEFQAYMLMEGAKSNLLADWVDAYALPLRRRLLSNGNNPVTIN